MLKDEGEKQNLMDNNKDNNSRFKKRPFFSFIIFYVIATILLNYFLSGINSAPEKAIRYDEFIDMIEKNEVEEVKFSSEKIIITPKDKETEKSADFTWILYVLGAVAIIGGIFLLMKLRKRVRAA